MNCYKLLAVERQCGNSNWAGGLLNLGGVPPSLGIPQEFQARGC